MLTREPWCGTEGGEDRQTNKVFDSTFKNAKGPGTPAGAGNSRATYTEHSIQRVMAQAEGDFSLLVSRCPPEQVRGKEGKKREGPGKVG